MPVVDTGLALSFSIVMFLIANLDRPGAGLIQTDISILLEVSERLNGQVATWACNGPAIIA